MNFDYLKRHWSCLSTGFLAGIVVGIAFYGSVV
jgi:hypothetical protein